MMWKDFKICSPKISKRKILKLSQSSVTQSGLVARFSMHLGMESTKDKKDFVPAITDILLTIKNGNFAYKFSQFVLHLPMDLSVSWSWKDIQCLISSKSSDINVSPWFCLV